MSAPSRVFVSGLPPNFTTDALRNHFAARFEVTDAHVIPKRRIGFVGFKAPDIAKEAVKYFNRTYIRMSRIFVQISKPVNAESKEPAKTEEKKPRDQQPTNNGQENGLKRKRGQDDTEEDPKLREFLSVMRPAAVKKTWQDDIILPSEIEQTKKDVNHEEERGQKEEQDSKPGNKEAVAQAETGASNDKENQGEIEGDTSKEKPDTEDPEVAANINTIRQTGRLFFRNLAYTVTEGELEDLVAPFGKTEEIHVAYDTRHETSKGFAYIQFTDPSSAIAAYKALDATDFQGRLLHVIPALTKKTYKLDDYEISQLPLKKQQQIKRRREAASATFSWNSLYMNADAVMSSVAERLGVPKADILDPTSSDAAIKQAHAETHVIQETKAYFSEKGVNLDSFKQRERGNNAILVKNFSYGVKVEDLKRLFEPFGQITRLLMPPTGTIAIVEFAMPDEAQRAFKGLAYRKLGDSILFLEKAPKNLFNEKVEASSTTAAAAPPPAASANGDVVRQTFSTSDAFRAEEPEDDNVDTHTLFIRNLNFSTTTEQLAEVFSPLAGFMSALVKTKPDPKKPGERLSMGFGFVEFRSAAHARDALAAMNGYKLHNHELVIKASHKGADAAEERRKADKAKKTAARSTKIIIKNLPFQATKKDIRALFGAYGKLRSVRVPQKFDRSTRGFGFADFVSAREAENAMDALKDSHLLGRRLVLEFAAAEASDAEEEIAKMEQKMAKQVNRVQANQLISSGGRRKFQVGAAEQDQ